MVPGREPGAMGPGPEWTRGVTRWAWLRNPISGFRQGEVVTPRVAENDPSPKYDAITVEDVGNDTYPVDEAES